MGTSHGLSVGSEMSAGVYNVLFDGITMSGAEAGAHVKSCRGRGGAVTNVTYRGLALQNVGLAVYLTLNYHSVPPTNATATPVFTNITIDGLTATGSGNGVNLDGLPESMIQGVTLSNLQYTGSGTWNAGCAYATGRCAGVVSPSCPPCL